MNRNASLADSLKTLLDQRGEVLLRDSRQLQALLADLGTPRAAPWQPRVVVFVVQQGLASDMWQHRERVDERRIHQWVAQLQDAFGLGEDQAEWAIQCWLAALDISVSSSVWRGSARTATKKVRETQDTPGSERAFELDPVTGSPTTSIACPKCKAKNSAEEAYCADCGTLLHGSRSCPHCRRSIPAHAVFCTHLLCGKAV